MIADTNATKGYDTVMKFSQEFGRNKITFIQIKAANYVLLKSFKF